MLSIMTPLFKKLNYKNQAVILVLNSPASLGKELNEMSSVATLAYDAAQVKEIEFVLAFVTTEAEIDAMITSVYARLKGDAVLWFCYPKGTSKKYKCDINRDKGWNVLGKYDLEAVRQVAIDEDWSALRFRKVKYIKVLRRNENLTLSDAAKKRLK